MVVLMGLMLGAMLVLSLFLAAIPIEDWPLRQPRPAGKHRGTDAQVCAQYEAHVQSTRAAALREHGSRDEWVQA